MTTVTNSKATSAIANHVTGDPTPIRINTKKPSPIVYNVIKILDNIAMAEEWAWLNHPQSIALNPINIFMTIIPNSRGA